MTDGVTESVRVLAGRYQVGELLGHGGMADVYLGTDARLGRKVAIKLLKPSLANDPVFRTRFRQEAQAAARMAHPTIVRVFDAGEETVREANGIEVQVPFIIMEYVQGRLLKDMIAQGALEPAEAVRIIDGVLTALEYSHRAGVVHRDIKPGNIMVTSNGQVKVMDFGIARAISESSATIAQTSAILGTAQYFSPEQARGEAVDARTDLYSTGVVLYEMLTGRPPFRGDTAVAVAYQHVSEAPVPPNAIKPAISPALNAVVLRALTKDRFERFQTAAAFRQDVEVAGAGKVPSRTPAGSDDFNSTLFGVNPNSSAASEATLRRLANEDADRAPRSTQTRPPVALIWGGIVVIAVIIVAVMFWVFTLTPQSISLSIKVPDVVGEQVDAGTQTLLDAKLVSNQIPQASLEPEGVILRTEPKAGTPVGEGQEVTVYVSSGPADVFVPNLNLKALAAGQQALTDASLVPGEVTKVNSPIIPVDQIVATDPAAGSSIPAGTTVNITVSSGLVTVPDVRGQTLEAAQAAFGAPEVQISPKIVSDAGCTGNAVTKQSASGDVPIGTVIELTYCSGG